MRSQRNAPVVVKDRLAVGVPGEQSKDFFRPAPPPPTIPNISYSYHLIEDTEGKTAKVHPQV